MPLSQQDITNPEGFSSTRRAVIDIGSNSVRLVIYGGYTRAPLIVFNEKTLCGLGKRDSQTGELREEAITQAIETLVRFSQILRASGNPPVTVFATAATRDAPNGPSFIEKVRIIGFEPKVLSGEEEAKFAALGVLSGTPKIAAPRHDGMRHMCGDMGGGSLELTRFSNDAATPLDRMATTPLGPLNVMAKCGPSVAGAVDYVRSIIKQEKWLYEVATGNLYTVGGAWRLIANIHMAQVQYPMHILHHYEMTVADVMQICQFLETQSPEALKAIPGIQLRRIETLPHAAMVLRVLLEEIAPESVIVSANGVREGILYDHMSEEDKNLDPFLTLARFYAARYAPYRAFGEACIDFSASLFHA